MFSHAVVRAKDLNDTKAFYGAVLGTLGQSGSVEAAKRTIYMEEDGILVVMKPYDGAAASSGNGVSLDFNAPDAAAVDAFRAAGIMAGDNDEGAPGPRPAMENS